MAHVGESVIAHELQVVNSLHVWLSKNDQLIREPHFSLESKVTVKPAFEDEVPPRTLDVVGHLICSCPGVSPAAHG